MFLKSIEIQGFKSFADKTVLRFGKGTTAVVGPNGSGKSNVSDAVRWVLGEQSTKNLRGQAMEDVIFSGTPARRAPGFAEVTLNIENDDRSLNFDKDTVSVTRRYYRSHESEYLINGVAVRLKDVHELFMDTGLGRDGYSIVGQGKIDNIVSSKSSERRDIFEEASGISKYRYRKTESEHKLKAAEENLVRLKDIAEELKNRVGPLAEQSTKAEQFLKYSAEKRELEIGLWLHTLSVSGEAIKNHEQKLLLAKAQYAETCRALTDMETEGEQSAGDFNRITLLIDETRRRMVQYEEEVTRIDGELAVLENTRLHNNESIERLLAEIEELNTNDSKTEEDIKERNERIEEKKVVLVGLRKDFEEISKKLMSLIGDSESISAQIEEKTKKLNELSAEHSECQVRVLTARSSLTEIEGRSDTISSETELKKAEYQKLLTEFNQLQKDLEELEERIVEHENALKGYEIRLKSRSENVNTIKEKLDGIKNEIEGKERRAQILEDLERNMEGFSYSVKAVMKGSGEGMLRGIHGPVSRLIKVEQQYGTAIEIALGQSTQNIVVETENDAKRAIAMLKASDKGRATFLPVSSIKGRELEQRDVKNSVGFVGIASEIVKCDLKYKEIIKSLLGRTVVAEDIDSAVAIAKKFSYRFKIVSLDGQVINAGGSLTGGSLAKNVGLLGRASDIERLRNEAKNLKKKYEEQNTRYTAAASGLAAVEADILATRGTITTAGEDKIRVIGEIRRIGEQKIAAEQALKGLENESETLESKKKNLSLIISKAEVEIIDVLKRRETVETELDTMSGGRTSRNDLREKISEQLTEIKLRIIESEKDIESLEQSAKLLRESISYRTSRADQLKTEVETTSQKNTELNLRVEDYRNTAEEIKGKIAEQNKALTDLARQRDDSDRRSGDLRRLEREKNSEKELAGGEVVRLTERGESMLKEYDDIAARMYDEYEMTRSEAEEKGIIIEKPIEAKKRLKEIKTKIRSLGTVNVAAIEEYKEVSERYDFMSTQIADIEASRDELYRLIDSLTGKMKEMFASGFSAINDKFGHCFADMFGGGSAELKLSDPTNLLESGIEIIVKLPGKNVPSIEGLSGGEKALIAIAIYFAIMHTNPPAFCILDEVDSALDEVNVDMFANYMKKSGIPTQFICITHRRGTMESADMLYGVTMQQQGISRLLELNVAELEKKIVTEKR